MKLWCLPMYWYMFLAGILEDNINAQNYLLAVAALEQIEIAVCFIGSENICILAGPISGPLDLLSLRALKLPLFFSVLFMKLKDRTTFK